jgi:3-hydroxyisobutyrate dehydrogenase-like beta-hydroxyacid dehydrogenase
MKITFIGLGKMGTAIVERLIEKGHEVKVYNRTASKMLALVQIGALSSDTLKDAVKDANLVMTSLLDDNAVLKVTNEMLSYLPKGSIHIGLSTILPDIAKDIEKYHHQHGSHYISAVVLGIPKVAKEGNLTTFCAGNREKVEAVFPLLSDFSGDVIPMEEDVTHPLLMKICMNYSLMTAIELISELYTFAEKSGLDKEYVKGGLHAIYGHPGFKQYINKIDEQTFDAVNFNMIGGNKDIALFQEAFAKVGVSPELANVTRSRFITALAQGKQDKDWSAIYEVIREQSGLSIK